MPSIMLAFAFGIDALSKLAPRKYHTAVAWGIGIACIGMTAVADWRAYFVMWSNHPEVLRIYRDDLEQLGRYLAEHDTPLALVAVPNADLDALTYYMGHIPPKNPTMQLVFFESESTIVLSSDAHQLFISPFTTVSQAHQHWLDQATPHPPIFDQAGNIAFRVYQSDAMAIQAKLAHVGMTTAGIAPDYTSPTTAISYPIRFDDMLELLAVEFPRLPVNAQGDGLELWLYLRPLVSYSDQRANIFVHVVDEQGEIVRQRDMLGVPPSQWNTNTLIIQDHFIWFDALPAGRYRVMLGVYDWQTLARYSLADAQDDFIVLGMIEVR